MAARLSQQALSGLIGAIYDCALDPGRWEPTLVGLREALDYASAALSLVALPSGRALLDISAYSRPDWSERVRRSPGAVIDMWGGMEAVMRLPLGEPLVLSRIRDRALWEDNRMYREWGRAQGIHDFVAVGLVRDAGAVGSLGFVRHVTAGDVGDPEVALARLLVPHVQRAIAISRLLEVRSIEQARMAEALDALRCGVVLLNARGTILHANQAAERMLAEGAALREVRRTLGAASPAAARELRAAIALAARDEAGIGRRGLAVRLTEPGAPPALAHVMPLTGGELRARLQPAAVAAVFVTASPDEGEIAATLAAAYGLTPAECRVLVRLLAGRSLAEAAADLGTALSTARTHLDSIFAKTGTARQAELMRLALQAAPPAAPVP